MSNNTTSARPAFDLAIRLLGDRVGKEKTTTHGRELVCRCPFHNDRNPSFHLNLDSGMWICWSGCGGGWLNTLLRRLGVSESSVRSVLDGVHRPEGPKKVDSLHQFTTVRKSEVTRVLPESTLSVFAHEPWPMLDDGWDPATLATFEIGYDRSEGRTTFPIRHADGTLAAISGRTPYPYVEPKYLIYRRERLHEFAPSTYEPDRSGMIYNLHRVLKLARPGQRVAICEGFKEPMRLHEAEVLCVSTLGIEVSAGSGSSRIEVIGKQLSLLNRLVHETQCVPVIMFDDDPAGRKGADRLARRMINFCQPMMAFTSVLGVKDASDTRDLRALKNIVETAPTFLETVAHAFN